MIPFSKVILLGLFLFSGIVSAQTSGQIQILRVDAMGSGCKPGSVNSTISPDNKELSLLFDDFISQAGGQTSAAVDKKMCVINIDLAIPDGFSFGLISADYRGFAALDAGTMGQHEVLYSFNKSFAGSSFSSQVLRGPMNQNYYFQNLISPQLVQWSQCGVRQVTLTMRVGVVAQMVATPTSAKPSAMMTLDSVDSSTRQSFQVAWRNCPGSGGGRPVDPGNGGRPTDPNRPTNPGNGGGGRPTFPGGGGGGQTDNIEIYQMWNGQTRYLTQDSRLVERGAWVNQGIAFDLMRQMSSIGNMALYQCLVPSIGKYFVTTDARCEGQQMERSLGYLSSAGNRGLVPLIRYYNPANVWDRIATTSPQEASGYIQERVLGYVIKTRP